MAFPTRDRTGGERSSVPFRRAHQRAQGQVHPHVLALQRTAGNRAVAALLGRTGLPAPVEVKMERAFGADFSDVRVSPNSPSADALGVEAYTEGADVHLRPGRYQPDTPTGQALIGHELAHVVQQRQGRVGATMQARGRLANDDHALEQEAERAGRRAAEGSSAALPGGRDGATPVRGSRSPVLQAAGIELLKDKDPDPTNTAPLRDWQTLKAAAAPNPTALDVHQILLTATKLHDGWKSGLGDVQQALANKYAENEGIPTSEISFGELVASKPQTVAPRRVVKKMPARKPVKGKGKARFTARGEGYKAGLEALEKTVEPPQKRRFLRGTWARADLLTPKGEAGSDATTGAYVDYGASVEGHLLNAHLHGPAEHKNLAPFRGSLNKKHSALVEEPLKKMIYNQGRFFRYHVVVNGDEFFPESITCTVDEVDRNKALLADGYHLVATISQDGSVSGVDARPTGAPDKRTKMSFTPRGGAGPSSIALTDLWDLLRFPWTEDYGEVMKEVLDTAYLAVRRYEATAGQIGTSLLALPRTAVTYTTATLTRTSGEDVTTGKRMVADPLTLWSPADGSVGFQPVGAWGVGAIKGHLLNHHLHGPAKPKNLAPMSPSLNQQFERDVESVAKQMVLQQGAVVRYEVTMSGADELIGFEDAPTKLTYSLRAYERRPGLNLDYEQIGNWRLKGDAVKQGDLSNSKDLDYRPGDYLPF